MASIIGNAVVFQFSQVNLNICNRRTGTLVIRKAKDSYKERTTDIQKGHAMEGSDQHTLNVLSVKYTKTARIGVNILLLILKIGVQELKA